LTSELKKANIIQISGTIEFEKGGHPRGSPLELLEKRESGGKSSVIGVRNKGAVRSETGKWGWEGESKSQKNSNKGRTHPESGLGGWGKYLKWRGYNQ